MTIPFFVAEAILTRPIRAAIEQNGPELVRLSSRFDPVGYALIETGHIPDIGTHLVHQQFGIGLRDRGTIQFLAPVRGDELDAPVICLRTESVTTELLARATVAPYFGFSVAGWVGPDADRYDGLIVDELAGLAPPESGYREDLVRAWFVLTGMPLVQHVLAVPAAADPAETDSLIALLSAVEFAAGSHIAEIAAESGATIDAVGAVFAEIDTELMVEHRRSIPELFARARLGPRFGAVPWLT